MTASSIRKRIALGVVLFGLILVGSLCAQSVIGNFVAIMLNGNRIQATAGTATVTVQNATHTIVGRDTADSLTNKTLDAEGTGNLITIPWVYWWAPWCGDTFATIDWSYGTQAVDGPTPACQVGSPTVAAYATLNFDDSATEQITHDLLLPSDWSGAADLKILWFSTATSGNVVWQVATLCTADGETESVAGWTFNTAQTITDATKGTSSLLNTATLTPVTMTGCAAGELLHLKIFRDPTHASDTIGAVAALVGVEFTIRRAM